MKILVIEDNVEIAQNIKNFLELEDGIEVKLEHSGDTWLETAVDKNFDIILLDVMLPVIWGFKIAEKIKSKKDTPIIMITAKDTVEDTIWGLKSWADDYIVKPFDLNELEARIEAVTRRIKTTSAKIWDLEIDLKKRKFVKDGNEITLTQKEFLIVEYLMINKGQPVSRTDIIEHIWGENSIWENDSKLDVYMSNIRSKLGKNLISTVKWFWYEIK